MSDTSRYWQIAAGAMGRDYADICIRFGMAFVGGAQQAGRMATTQVGDYVLLKRGLSEIVAVGRVVERDGKYRGDGDKPWLRDVDGWDLKAWCYVDWRKPTAPLEVNGLTRSTIERVQREDLQQKARTIYDQATAVPVESEPAPSPLISDEELLEFLMARGLQIANAETLMATIRRIRRLAKYYYDNLDWSEVREHETRTFLVAPLLLALGWPELAIKIEQPVPGGRMDLALYRETYRTGSKPMTIIETKGFAHGLSFAPSQAMQYAEHFPECLTIFVTNGYCYKAYTREAGNPFMEQPSGYLNILSPREHYPLDSTVGGAQSVLEILLR